MEAEKDSYSNCDDSKCVYFAPEVDLCPVVLNCNFMSKLSKKNKGAIHND